MVGSNILQTKFRVLKIDRTVPYELAVTDDKVRLKSSYTSKNKQCSQQWHGCVGGRGQAALQLHHSAIP